ncbi:MAG: hypothetical protein OEN50_11760 [Deltaproteobacteria bacterium]|nr:hypothetical protein [Deltaproteobacteria bacterium]
MPAGRHGTIAADTGGMSIFLSGSLETRVPGDNQSALCHYDGLVAAPTGDD